MAANDYCRSYEWAISDDGNKIVFDSGATNLVAIDTNGLADVFLREVRANRTLKLSNGPGVGGMTNGISGRAAISGNGAYAVFGSSASNLIAVDTNGIEDLFVCTTAGGPATRVSVSSAGAEANGYSAFPALSDDGNEIVFMSAASNLVAGDFNGATDVFLRNRSASTTTRVSVSSLGMETSTGASLAAVSGSGSIVAFSSEAIDLVGGGTNGVRHIFLHRMSDGITIRASRNVAGVAANGWSDFPDLDYSGDALAYLSFATNLVAVDTNGEEDAFLRTGPFIGPLLDLDENPVTFSVNGPVDPHTEGIRHARGVVPLLPPTLPGNPLGFAARIGPVPQARGVPSVSPGAVGDVNDHFIALVPSEAPFFESDPPLPPFFLAAPPSGNNNQIVAPGAIGLAAGPGIPAPLWTSLPSTMPAAPLRDNVDAISFGQDYFPALVTTGLDESGGVDPPPTDIDGEILAFATPWAARGSTYLEPIVVDDAPGISFRASVDPWAIGTAGTAVEAESGGAGGDTGAGVGLWVSTGDAAGDVFRSANLLRSGGVTLGGGSNMLVHDDPALALMAAALPDTSEDDLDGLECVGENGAPWFGPPMLRPGDVHDRVDHVIGDGMPPPGASFHDVINAAPMFFSVTRNSPGMPGSAVRSQFVMDGGAAADVFVTAKPMVPFPPVPLGVGTNLLFLDEAEIGMLAADASPMGTGPLDLTDDLDGLILWVCPELRMAITAVIDSIMMAPAPPMGMHGQRFGVGYTSSIVSYLKPMLLDMPKCIRVGFSVTTDAVGLEYTAVDWEAGPVLPAGTVAAAAGDVFYAMPDGEPVNSNYLWYEEVDLGFDAGGWINGTSTDLVDLSDNLDALDSIYMPAALEEPTDTNDDEAPAPRAPRGANLEPNVPNPFNPRTTIRWTQGTSGHVRLTILDAAGRAVATLVNEERAAGAHRLIWDGRDAHGQEVGSGVYFVRLEALDELRSRKITLVK